MTASAYAWQSVRAEALRRIRTREWPPGAMIPKEAEIAQELGCARATVNRALRDLAEAGYLDRRRKGGTRVTETPVRRAVFEIAIIRHEVEQSGASYGYTLLEDRTERLPDELAATLDQPRGTRWRRVIALHSAGKRPFCLEDRWLNPGLVPRERADFAASSANEWLVRNVPFTGGELSFQARKADTALASRLGCARGSAVFGVERITRTDDAAVTAVTLTYAPGYRLTTSLG
ncbi:GntR family transcriptional regulator [Glycocaulis sp.]|uniref:GntR family transcriptional regulator n=1 Tax=Glycocaulis sp. TaxID=1969725 RepID=UPI003F704152